MDMRTPLGKVRGLGSAKDGTDHFWRQRLTAAANIPLMIFFVAFIVSHTGSSFAELRASLANPVISVLLGLVVISGLWHGKLGMQVVIEDYIHNEAAKVVLLALNAFFAVLIGALSLFAVLKTGFAG